MAQPLSYSIEEAREILLDQAITLEAHIYLEGRREEYVRAEDYDRPTILQSCFQSIWSTKHSDWDWDKDPAELPDSIAANYNAQRDVSTREQQAAGLTHSRMFRPYFIGSAQTLAFGEDSKRYRAKWRRRSGLRKMYAATFTRRRFLNG